MKKLLAILIGFAIFATAQAQDETEMPSGLWIETEGISAKEMMKDDYETLSKMAKILWFIPDNEEIVGMYEANGEVIKVSPLTRNPHYEVRDQGVYAYNLEDGSYLFVTMQEKETSIVTFKEKAGIFYDFIYYSISEVVHTSELTN